MEYLLGRGLRVDASYLNVVKPLEHAFLLEFRQLMLKLEDEVGGSAAAVPERLLKLMVMFNHIKHKVWGNLFGFSTRFS